MSLAHYPKNFKELFEEANLLCWSRCADSIAIYNQAEKVATPDSNLGALYHNRGIAQSECKLPLTAMSSFYDAKKYAIEQNDWDLSASCDRWLVNVSRTPVSLDKEVAIFNNKEKALFCISQWLQIEREK